jgi:hypothetical protein
MLVLATGVVATTLSNESGAYSLPSLLPGQYKLSAELNGFRDTVIVHEVAVAASEGTVPIHVPCAADGFGHFGNASIAGVNGPANTVISGRRVDVLRVSESFKTRGVRVEALKVTGDFRDEADHVAIFAEHHFGRSTFVLLHVESSGHKHEAVVIARAAGGRRRGPG